MKEEANWVFGKIRHGFYLPNQNTRKQDENIKRIYKKNKQKKQKLICKMTVLKIGATKYTIY